uniref:Uncharacterized protein n=1 Tax=Salix viminalis TaxID=40686 RepID=A0A6N2KE73_SALVM
MGISPLKRPVTVECKRIKVKEARPTQRAHIISPGVVVHAIKCNAGPFSLRCEVEICKLEVPSLQQPFHPEEGFLCRLNQNCQRRLNWPKRIH